MTTLTATRPDAVRLRRPRRALHGVLLFDKPLGLSSNDALQQVKRLYGAEKAGHTGTLDPLATGLLPLAFGAATKFSQSGLDADKTYRATLRLGVTRVGGDLEGEVIETRPVEVDDAALAAACLAMTGEIEQLPPMHSALKHEGRALYEYAREGLQVERAPRRVRVHRLAVLARRGDELDLEARVSKGTYIRTLAEDLGRALGCGAHLVALRRTASGALALAEGMGLDALAALDEPSRDTRLLSVDALLADRPAIRLDAPNAARFLSGLRRRLDAADAPLVRVYGPWPPSAGLDADGRGRAFLGSGHVCGGELIPTRLLSPPEVEAIASAPHGRPATPLEAAAG